MGDSDFTLKMIYDQGKTTASAFNTFKDDVQKDGCAAGKADRVRIKSLEDTIKTMPDDIAKKVAESVNGNGDGSDDEIEVNVGLAKIVLRGKRLMAKVETWMNKGLKILVFLGGVWLTLAFFGFLPKAITPKAFRQIEEVVATVAEVRAAQEASE